MNEFKVNLFFAENSKTLQEIMNELFIIFIKNKLETCCKNPDKELRYIYNN